MIGIREALGKILATTNSPKPAGHRAYLPNPQKGRKMANLTFPDSNFLLCGSVIKLSQTDEFVKVEIFWMAMIMIIKPG